MKADKNRILITQSQLKNYSGSEVVTLELIEHFSGLGYDVTVLTHFFADPIKKDIGKTNARVVLINSEEASGIYIKDYDVIWIHHYAITSKQIEEMNNLVGDKPLVVFHHMSFIDPIEATLFVNVENKLSNVIAFNSFETRDKYDETLGSELDKSKTFVLDNPAPDSFLKSPSSNNKKLSKLAIVSNHPPDEVMQAIEEIRKAGVDVDVYGRIEGGIERRMTAELVSSYDAIVSIGKTVQYGILANVPVYCYDRFGGPGFINKTNFDVAHKRNFSGRGFEKKDASVIAKEIMTDYKTTQNDFEEVNRLFAKDFLLSHKIDMLFEFANKNKNQKVSSVLLYQVMRYLDIMARIFPRYCRQMHVLEPRLQRAQAAVVRLTEENQHLSANLSDRKEQIDGILNSKSMRLIARLRSIKDAITLKNK